MNHVKKQRNNKVKAKRQGQLHRLLESGNITEAFRVIHHKVGDPSEPLSPIEEKDPPSPIPFTVEIPNYPKTYWEEFDQLWKDLELEKKC